MARWGFLLSCSLVVLLLVWEGLRITTFASFKVPSGSMQPSILPGECIYVNKWKIGARIFNIFEAINGKPVSIHRLPGMRQVMRSDVVVFNYPYHLYDVRYDSIRLNMRTYFVKRCIGIPGDNVEIRNGKYLVNGKDINMGIDDSLKDETSYPRQIQEKRVERNVFRIDTARHWTQKEFGPLHIPQKGEKLNLSVGNVQTYRNIIEWEQHKQIRCAGASVLLGDSIINNYSFLQDYYFMAGDNVNQSEDSRYWGLVPADFIVGVASFIWKSRDPDNGKMRRERLFKAI